MPIPDSKIEKRSEKAGSVTAIEGQPLRQRDDSSDSLPLGEEELRSRNWKEKLEELREEPDPWHLSVTDIARSYRTKLVGVSGSDLEISARMIRVCALLLRLKADLLEGKEGEGQWEQQMEEALEEEFGFVPYEEFEQSQFVPQLELPLKRIPTRTVSRQDLARSRREAQKLMEKRKRDRDEQGEEEEDWNWGLTLDDMSGVRDRLQNLYGRIKRKVKRGGRLLFSQLLGDEPDKKDELEEFIHLLHLRGQGKVECEQEEPFGDIEIKVREEGG